MATRKRGATKRKAVTKTKRPNVSANRLPDVKALASMVLGEVRRREAANGKRKKRNAPRCPRRNTPEDVPAPPKKITGLVEEFLGHGLESVEYANAPAWCPNDAVNGGRVVAIEYEAFKPHLDPDGPKIYRHEFGPGVTLMCFTGDRVIVLLGDYTIGPDGIEG